mmetsp:Transcript_14204/g.31020  ORF Transcript_14204/g.31020 Transcript_14204/m.31020 type:complete len:523 (+) Transcript_14204:492-2060(+)|eukprot:CAMPEP_0168754570 /NCGR_PEP_ID=MMETSP0724-20121128/19575_1 /TAXON_ID=265536 /ORGANISM="Amphiprora sp., Strain CCMP467" /LENGTH=522 /DNA_ID=CAMNT_0008803065 /DNA_START=372 /DNA_END=1940 /DNA_ORIENTATION=+
MSNNHKNDTAAMKPSDAESMLASALLEIRSDTRGEVAAAGKSPERTSDESKGKKPTKKRKGTNNQESPNNKVPVGTKKRALPPKKTMVPNPIAPPNLAPASQTASLMGQPSVSYPAPANPPSVFTPEQLAALRVAAAASAASFAAAASNPVASHMNLIQQAALSNHHHHHHGLPTLQQRPPGMAHHHQPIAPASAQAPASLQHVTSPGRSVPEQNNGGRSRSGSVIRRDQVEAALRSKPQRGRKREDLSELERLELTRTRNREHAKSTRIRKKARYQELLDIEKRYEIMEHRVTLNAKRRAAISQFLKAREVMLRHPKQSSDVCSHSSGEQTAPVNNSKRDETAKDPPPAAELSAASACAWEEFVEDPASFQFDEGWPRDESSPSTAADQMSRFDEYVQSCVASKFGHAVIPLLSLTIRGEESGIALDEASGGLAEVEVSLAGPTRVILMTGMVRFLFGQESEKLRLVSYVNAVDLLASTDRLHAQASHPSTVSLDPVVAGGEANQKPEAKQDESGGPGMNI